MTRADAELLEAWRAVANAKLNELRRPCWRLSGLVRPKARPNDSRGILIHVGRPVSPRGLVQRVIQPDTKIQQVWHF